jgi:hypothetical protein
VWEGHFGMAPQYCIFDRTGNLVEKRANPYGVGGEQERHHNNPMLIADLLPECDAFIGQHLGRPDKLQSLGVRPVCTQARDPQLALRDYIEIV